MSYSYRHFLFKDAEAQTVIEMNHDSQGQRFEKKVIVAGTRSGVGSSATACVIWALRIFCSTAMFIPNICRKMRVRKNWRNA